MLASFLSTLLALTLPPLWAVTPDSAICYYSDKLEFDRVIVHGTWLWDENSKVYGLDSLDMSWFYTYYSDTDKLEGGIVETAWPNKNPEVIEFEREIISTFVPQTYHKVMKNLRAGYLKPIHGSGFSASFTIKRSSASDASAVLRQNECLSPVAYRLADSGFLSREVACDSVEVDFLCGTGPDGYGIGDIRMREYVNGTAGKYHDCVPVSGNKGLHAEIALKFAPAAYDMVMKMISEGSLAQRPEGYRVSFVVRPTSSSPAEEASLSKIKMIEPNYQNCFFSDNVECDSVIVWFLLGPGSDKVGRGYGCSSIGVKYAGQKDFKALYDDGGRGRWHERAEDMDMALKAEIVLKYSPCLFQTIVDLIDNEVWKPWPAYYVPIKLYPGSGRAADGGDGAVEAVESVRVAPMEFYSRFVDCEKMEIVCRCRPCLTGASFASEYGFEDVKIRSYEDGAPGAFSLWPADSVSDKEEGAIVECLPLLYNKLIEGVRSGTVQESDGCYHLAAFIYRNPSLCSDGA